MWTVCSPMSPLINFINNARNNNNSSDYTLKIMADTGQEKKKVGFCIIPNEEQEKKKKSHL